MSDVGTVGEWNQIARDQAGGEDSCVPRFYLREVQNTALSEKEGRPRFDMKPYVEIFIPGEKHNRPDRPVNENDKRRWPGAWEKFQATQQEVLEGTPIEQWPYLNRAQVAEMKALGVMTIESLAGMADGLLEKLGPGGRDLQSRARQHLQPQGETETELREAHQALISENKELKARVTQLETSIDAMNKPKKRKSDDTEDDLSERAT